MAVLRSNRIFAATIAPGAVQADPTSTSPDVAAPRLPDSGVEQHAVTVYTCPAGIRTIIRTIQSTLLTSLPTTEGYSHTHVMVLRTAEGLILNARWFWWWDLFPPAWDGATHWARLLTEDTWNAQLVLNPGDILQTYNGTPVQIDQVATGALVDIPA